MSTQILLDTHIFIWLMEGVDRLSKKTQNYIIEAAQQDQVYVAAISLWEIAMLEKKGRVSFHQPCLQWIEQSLKAPGINILPLSPEIAVDSAQLAGDFHGDPADRLIVASARYLNATLITADQKIIAYAKKYEYLSCIMPK
jgi:PIN domain nuclease of toxin-antitoxin system